MLINVADEEESRVAIVEDGILEEFTIETSSKEQIKGNVYNGVVVKVEPSLQAAFVDYGGKRHGFLPMGEIQPRWYIGEGRSDGRRDGRSEGRNDDHDRRPRIQDVIRRGQKLLVQVVKEEVGSKGASLSAYVSLAGRYLVVMPGSDTAGGISRKIEDEEERKKLKEIMTELDPPPDVGVIVRTAGLNRSKLELQRDMHYLQRLWASIEERSRESPAPALIYQEHDLVIRSIRDYFTPDIQEVLIDHREVYRGARDFFQAVMPRYQGRVQLYRDKKPLFARYQLEEQIDAIHSHKVELRSGGSIVIDTTEALVAIDVNSGRATREKGIEETAFKTNTEAAIEIARQLRLRDLGGLIVIDFIDMRNAKHAQEIEKTIRLALKRDKARTQVSHISQFGLLELSRQRLKPTFMEGQYLACPHCEGSGLVQSVVSLSLAVLRRIRAEAAKENLAVVKAMVPMEVALYLLNQKRQDLVRLEEEYQLTLHVAGNASARQNEYTLDFIKREGVAEALPMPERALGRDGEEPVRPLTSVAAYRGVTWDEPEEVEEEAAPIAEVEVAEPVAAAVSVPEPEPEDLAPVLEPAAVFAVPRGRVFWRVTSLTAMVDGSANERPAGRGGRPGRQGPSRFSRRPRGGWWRRRSGAGAPADAAHRTETGRGSDAVS